MKINSGKITDLIKSQVIKARKGILELKIEFHYAE